MRARFIDDEAQESDEEESDDTDVKSVTTEVAQQEDEDFIVEVVARRFGFAPRVEFNSGESVSANQLVPLDPTALVGIRGKCSVGYNSDCSKPRGEPSFTGSGVSGGDIKTSILIGDNYGEPSRKTSSKRRKVVPQAVLKSVVPASISERCRLSQRQAPLLSSSSQAVSPNAVSTVQTTAMDQASTSI